MPPAANAPIPPASATMARPYLPGPRIHCRRLANLVVGYYQVHAHLPGAPTMPLALENLLLAVQMPCTQPHPDEQTCPDCQRLLAELIAAVRAEAGLRLWPITRETIAQIEAGPPDAPATHGDSPTRRAIALLPRLASYRAVLHGPCARCGSRLWAEVPGSYRCLICAPPLHFPDRLRVAIQTTCQ